MAPFDFAIYMGVVCSVIMVVGGLLLLLRGAITLTRQPTTGTTSSALSAEFHGLRLATDTPTIALFGVGVIFLGVSVWFSQPQKAEIVPVQVRAQIERDALDGAEPTIYAAIPLTSLVSQADENGNSVVYNIDTALFHRGDPAGENVTIIAFMPGGKYTMRSAYVEKAEQPDSIYARSVRLERFRLPSSQAAPPLNRPTIEEAPLLPALEDSRLEGG